MKMNNVTAVVGANWGDEGKGKVIDYLAGQADFVVRFQGGQNAGHTIINPYGKFVMHLLPSGVFYPNIVNILGPGVALDINALLMELKSLKERNVPEPKIYISERAQIVLPVHVLFDKYEEERLGGDQFGSTQKGIAPFYGDKYMKLGIQAADLYDGSRLRKRMGKNLFAKNVWLKHVYQKPLISTDDAVDELLEMAENIRPFVCDTTQMLHQALGEDKHILLEGQLGALRDPDHGIYPYTTSSSTLAGFASVGAGIPPQAMQNIVAVTKAYSTCVGAGPFVTEIQTEEAQTLRDRGGDAGEYGATTGRPRRIGWFDAAATRYGCRIQGATTVALSMLDVLGCLDRIPICTAYEINGQRQAGFPASVHLEKSKPIYEVLDGWKCDISNIRRFEDLPPQAKNYMKRIETLIEVPIRWVSVGPGREAMILRKQDPLLCALRGKGNN
jgi:adenylosuccinate synthase